jgi:hypothetical protein
LHDVGYNKEYAAVSKDIDDDGEEWFGLKYEQLIAPLIKAVQELKVMVEDLQNGQRN